jgi:hypothetical protein
MCRPQAEEQLRRDRGLYLLWTLKTEWEKLAKEEALKYFTILLQLLKNKLNYWPKFPLEYLVRSQPTKKFHVLWNLMSYSSK